MGEVAFFDAASRRRLPASPQSAQVPYETYLAYQQAEAAFRALCFGQPLDPQTAANRPSTKIVRRHWATVTQLADTLQREKSLSREQVLKLLLHASSDVAVGAEA
jgi:hypothetical protein